MDIFFQDPNEIPLPPEQVRIRELGVQPFSDGQRLRVYLEVDPFQKRPSADLAVRILNGDVLATASVIESMTRKIELTLHLRFPAASGVTKEATVCTLSAVLYYQAAPAEPVEEGQPIQLAPALVVDEKTVNFLIALPE